MLNSCVRIFSILSILLTTLFGKQHYFNCSSYRVKVIIYWRWRETSVSRVLTCLNMKT